MCQLKSAIVLKDRIYMPDHDRHQQMLEELGISDTSGNPDFVRVELLPPDDDVFADIDLWQLSVDQDFRPSWFFRELELPKIRECAKAWAKEHIFVDTDDLDLKKGSTYYLRNCKNATLRENSTATLRENSTATLWENSTATLWDSSTAIMPSSCRRAKRENFVLMDNSTLKDCNTKTIYQAGDWKLVAVNG